MTEQKTQTFVDFAQFVADLPNVTEERALTQTLLRELYKKLVLQDDTQKRQYLSDLEQALSLLDPQLTQRIENAVEHILLSDTSPETSVTTEQDMQSEPSKPPAKANITEPTKAEGKSKLGKSGERQKEKSDQNEDVYRQRCWDAALLSSSRELSKMTTEDLDMALQPKKDIVLHGSVYPKMTQEFLKQPVYIGPISSISLFSEFSHHFQYFDESGHIWFSFDNTTEDQQIAIPPWIQTHPDCIPLWQRWCDLLKWAILAPEAFVFMDIQNPRQQLGANRPSICKKLFDFHKNFTEVLNKDNKPEGDYYTYVYLHRIYSAFYQFLFSQDLNPDKTSEHVFATLRTEAKKSVKYWLEHLQIEELRPVGFGKKEFLQEVNDDAENDVDVTSLPVLLEGIDCQKNQVLYWLQPKWRLRNPVGNHPSDLKGRVLYYSGIS